MSNALGAAEFLAFSAPLIAWAIWEYRKTSALHKKTMEEERARAAKDDTSLSS